VRTISNAGTNGREIETKILRRKAQRRNRRPGIQNARDMMGGKKADFRTLHF
jgi:hypothetical protein